VQWADALSSSEAVSRSTYARPKTIVILGGGIGGVVAAGTLRKRLDRGQDSRREVVALCATVEREA
jgi:NADH dehydrogenase FAD-containing subunit